MAETRESAYEAFNDKVARYEAKYPGDMACLKKDKVVEGNAFIKGVREPEKEAGAATA